MTNTLEYEDFIPYSVQFNYRSIKYLINRFYTVIRVKES